MSRGSLSPDKPWPDPAKRRSSSNLFSKLLHLLKGLASKSQQNDHLQFKLLPLLGFRNKHEMNAARGANRSRRPPQTNADRGRGRGRGGRPRDGFGDSERGPLSYGPVPTIRQVVV